VYVKRGVTRSKYQELRDIDSRIWNTVEPGYNDIGLHDTSPITSDIQWYQLIRRC
jgi:hypothetical protein